MSRKKTDKKDTILAAAFRWLHHHERVLPELKRVYLIPYQSNGNNMLRLGRRVGMWPVAVDLARRDCHGLRLLILPTDSSMSVEERTRGRMLESDGYCVKWCNSWKEIIQAIVWYIWMEQEDLPGEVETFALVQTLCVDRLSNETK